MTVHEHEVRPVDSDVEQWLDQLDPATVEARDATHFRRIIAASKAFIEAETELRSSVAAARAAGDSWAIIGAALGVTRQAAQQRFRNVDKGSDPTTESASMTSDASAEIEPAPNGGWSLKVGPEIVEHSRTKQEAMTRVRYWVRQGSLRQYVIRNRNGVMHTVKVKQPRAKAKQN
jgi:hypothetical protein